VSPKTGAKIAFLDESARIDRIGDIGCSAFYASETVAEVKPVGLSWELETPASRETTWELFSDTDRFNRAANLGYSYEDLPQSDGTLIRRGSITRLGITVTWDEKPFQFARLDWFRSIRDFHAGPGAKLVTTARFRDLPKGGTRIRYTVQVTPRNLFYRPIVALELKTGTKRALDKTLAELMELLSNRDNNYDPTPPPLTANAADRVASFCKELDPPEIGPRLQTLLASGALRDQARIRPLGLAREWGFPQEEVVRACLLAARAGILTVQWEVLCPSCRGPKEVLPSLSFGGTRIHCYACNIRFDGTLADALEVTFRPDPQIRDFQVDVACAGSPSHQRHVVAQRAVPPEGRENIEVTLEPGPYRLAVLAVDRSGSGPDRDRELNPVLVDIDEGAPNDNATIHADTFGLMPARIRLRPGPIRISIASESLAALALKLELRWQAGDILTAGALLEYPDALDLIPGENIDPSFSATVVQQGVVVIESTRDHNETLDKAESSLAGRPTGSTQRGERRLVATFADAAQLIDAAVALASIDNTQVAIGWGSVVLAKSGEETAIWGAAVRHTLAVLPAAALHTVVVLYEAAANSPELAAAFQAREVAVVRLEGRLPGGRPIHYFKGN
jgi:hypothetical protein